LTPKIGFPWSEIRNVSYSSKKFVIKPTDKKAPDFIFYTSRLRINKRILSLSMGNHELYMRRRKPDSIEVQQMKAQTKEERLARQAERMMLQKEKQQREEAERKRKELEERLRYYEVEFENAKKELERSQMMALSLEERMKQAEKERRELEEAQRRAEEARQRAEEAAHLEKAEREATEQAAALAQAELEQRMHEAKVKEEETRRLHAELEAARIQMEENQSLLREALIAQQTIIVAEAGEDDANSEQSHELMVAENGYVPRPEEDRITQTEKNTRINEQLKTLSAELAATKVDSQVTRNDILHRQNVSQGRDKYKTLKQIRQGNTKQRVDMFEAM
jgi:radixin